MELSQLRYFVAVAQAGSMLQAARKLGVTQPAISRQIKNLECELDTRLFNRTDRGVVLTESGAAFYGRISEILASLDRVASELGGAASSHFLRLGLIQTSQWFSVITDALNGFRMNNPGVIVEGRQMLSRHQLEALRADEIDAAICATLHRTPRDIETLSLFELARGVVMSVRHPLSGRDSLTLFDLTPYPLLGYTHGTAAAGIDLLMDESRRAGFTPRLAEVFDSGLLLLERVRDGESIAFLPEPGDAAPMHELLFRTVRGIEAGVPFSMCWKRGARNPLVARFKTEMERQLRNGRMGR